jgi:hypothetical protein
MPRALLLLLLLQPRPAAPQDPPQQKQALPAASVLPDLQPPRAQDMNMPVPRDAQTSEFYLRTADPSAYNLAPFPLPLGHANPPVGYLTSPQGPTTGQTTPMEPTGPHDPTGLLFGAGPNFTLDQGTAGVFPIFQDDAPVQENVTFGGVAPRPPPSLANPVVPIAAPQCSQAGAYACAAALSACLGAQVSPSPTPALGPLGVPAQVDVGARGGLCACYAAHASCWAASGCRDVMPQSDVDYCHYTLNCPLRSCAGSGAGSAVAAAAALLVAAAAAAALV